MKTKILYILTGLIVIPFGLVVGGRIPYFILYVYLLTLLIPWLHCLLGKFFITGQIKVPQRELVAGENIKIVYEIVNPSIFTFCCLEVENSIAQELTGAGIETKIYALKPKDGVWSETVVNCRRRGIYEVGEIKINIKDTFNLFSLKKTLVTPISIKIYPAVPILHNVDVDTNQDFYSLSDLRKYQEGDPIKTIHWKASAKKDNLMVKNYEEEGEQEVVLILDSSIKSYLGDENRWVEDRAVETTLALVQYFLQKNEKVTLYYQKENKTLKVTGNHYGLFRVFMEEMVGFHPKGKDSFSKHIGEVSSKINQGTTLFLVTPLLDKNLGAQGIRLKMKNLHPRYIVLGKGKTDAITWIENKTYGKLLQVEGITTYMIGEEQDIRNILEGKYENGA